MQVLNPQHRAGTRKGRRHRPGVVGKDFLLRFGHGLQNRPSFVRQMTPHVIADFLPGVFHVAHQDGLPSTIEIVPPYPRNLLLPTCREEREGNQLWHVDLGFSPRLHLEEMLHQLVQLIQRWPAVTLFAFADHTHLAENPARVRHGQRVDLITPGRPRHRQHRAQVREIVADRLRLDAAALLAHSPLCELHQLLTAQRRIVELAQPGVLDCCQRRILGLAQRPDFLVLLQVLLDHLLDRHPFAVRALDGTRFRQLRLATLDPGLGDLLAIEGLAFLINCLPIPIDPYLRRVGRRVVLALT